MQRFNVGREVAILPLSLYTAGFTIGPTLAAPLSELYGRRVVYWSTMTLLLIFTAIAGSANNIAVLIIFRFLAGVGGSGSLAVGAGTIADIWDMQTHGGRAALFYIMAPFLGPALGPLTGAYIISEYHNDWRWSMWVVMIIAAPIALMALFMSETASFRILYLRQKKAGKKVAHQSGDTAILLHKLRIAFTRPLHMMFVEPLVAYLSIYTGFAFAMMFSFFGSYSYVFQSIYHFNAKETGLTFLGILVGFLFAVASFGIFDATLYRTAAVKAKGKPAPEHRLYAAMLGSVMLPIGLFWFAWSPMKDVHWIVPVLAGVPFGWGCLSIFISATTYLVDVYMAANSASAVAANGILRYGLGAAFPLFTLQMYEAVGVHWAGSVFAFVGLVGLPVPWIFFRYGSVLRRRSKYETSKN
jgi:MFS family permease